MQLRRVFTSGLCLIFFIGLLDLLPGLLPLWRVWHLPINWLLLLLVILQLLSLLVFALLASLLNEQQQQVNTRQRSIRWTIR